jgi:hypothetical protein
VDIFDYMSWCAHIREYTGLTATTTTVMGTIVVSFKLIIERKSNQTRT